MYGRVELLSPQQFLELPCENISPSVCNSPSKLFQKSYPRGQSWYLRRTFIVWRAASHWEKAWFRWVVFCITESKFSRTLATSEQGSFINFYRYSNSNRAIFEVVSKATGDARILPTDANCFPNIWVLSALLGECHAILQLAFREN